MSRRTARPHGWPKPTLRDHITGSWEALVEDWCALTGREPKPRSPEQNRARNLRRLRYPRKRSAISRAQDVWFESLEWVERHITQRDLHRQLDTMGRLLAPPEPTEWDEEEALARLRRELAIQRIGEQARAQLAASPPEDDPVEEAARRNVLRFLGVPLDGPDGAL